MLNETRRKDPSVSKKAMTDICPSSLTVRKGDSVYLFFPPFSPGGRASVRSTQENTGLERKHALPCKQKLDVRRRTSVCRACVHIQVSLSSPAAEQPDQRHREAKKEDHEWTADALSRSGNYHNGPVSYDCGQNTISLANKDYNSGRKCFRSEKAHVSFTTATKCL